MTSRIDAPTQDVADGLLPPRRGWSAIAIWLALLLAALDATIANVALPTIAGDLGTTPDRSIWVVNSYQIAITMTLLPLASLGEIVGFRRVYLVGVALFIVSSLSCTLAGDLTALAISRFVQGLGAAAVMATNGALVRLTYPRRLLGRGVGYNVLVIAVGSAAGPSLAAGILSIASWRWLFAINLPIGIAALAIGLRALPFGVPVSRPFDWRKALLVAVAFAAAFLGASGLVHGDRPLLPLVELVVAGALFLILVRLSRGDPAPLLPIDLLSVPLLRLSYATSACSFGAQ
ncbi:MAG TPA: MFS transporter, partial [Sphingomonas sp.]